MRFSREQIIESLNALEENADKAHTLSAKWNRTPEDEGDLSESVRLLGELTSKVEIVKRECPDQPSISDPRFIHSYAFRRTREMLEQIKKHPEYRTGILEDIREMMQCELERLKKISEHAEGN